MIFYKAKKGELKEDSGLQQLCNQVMEIDVAETGVKGAKSFFEAQVIYLFLVFMYLETNFQTTNSFFLLKQAFKQSFSSNFEREIREEQEERRRIEEQRKKKREEFMAKKSIFNQ